MQLIADSAGASGQYMVRSKTAPAVLFQVHVEEQCALTMALVTHVAPNTTFITSNSMTGNCSTCRTQHWVRGGMVMGEEHRLLDQAVCLSVDDVETKRAVLRLQDNTDAHCAKDGQTMHGMSRLCKGE